MALAASCGVVVSGAVIIPRPALTVSLGLALLLGTTTLAGELRVRTDYEGGSATVESVEQQTRTIRFRPGGDPARGWPCWWDLRVEGMSAGEKIRLELAGSDRPTRNNGQQTSTPLSPTWAMPGRASFSTDGKHWRHTEPGRRNGDRMIYEVTAESDAVRVSWGPLFTPADAAALVATAKAASPAARGFELCRTREGRPVPALRISEAATPNPYGVWIEARQHAWESGSSWVAQGLVEWLSSTATDAVWLRQQAVIFVVPIVDVDNVATGNGGKEADPHDQNRDWSDAPVYPEVAAAQKQLAALAAKGQLDLFVNLHNPAPGDHRPFFFCGPEELLTPIAKRNRAQFLTLAHARIRDPLPLEEKPRTTGASYHPLWRRMSGHWVTAHGNPYTVAACLETAWNTPHSTTDGYRTVGRQLGQAIAEHLRRNPRAPLGD